MRGRSSPNPPAPCNGFTIASLLLYVGGLPAVLQYLTVISQLGQIVDDDDATCDALNRGVYQYVEVKEHRMLLSQRREMPQLQKLGFRASDNDATRSGAFRRRIPIRRRKAPQVLLS